MGDKQYAKYLNRQTVKVICEPLTEYRICGSEDAKEFLSEYMKEFDREHAVALLLDVSKRIQSIYEISIGTLTGSLVHPREVFKAAILANADSIILAHNHLSAEIVPSDQDICITSRIQEAGKILGIPMLDHLIVGRLGCYSFAEETGLLKDLE